MSVIVFFGLNAKALTLPQNNDSLTETASPTPTITASPIPTPIPVTFTCHAGTTYAFNVTATIDLTNGMNQQEATMVAEEIINHEIASKVYELKSASVTDEGIWTVNFSWGLITPDGFQESLSHFFDVTINPSDRTATYIRCM